MNDKDVDEYINQMKPIERKAMEIAKEHLKTTFNIKKSNGFIEYMKKRVNK